MQFLDDLNEEQQKAVLATEGPTMILAGAGSGKTRVLTYKIAYLIQQGVDSFNILALTFTNKASREMKSRISSLLDNSESLNLWMGTFHSIFARILRFEAQKIGYPSNFTIYDTDDSKSLIKTIVKELNLDDKIYKPGLILNRISSAKNNLISAKEYADNINIQSDDLQSKKPLLGEIYKRYELRCFKASAMDFDDLLFKTNILLRDHPEVLFKYQDKFKYILVDEFQDTNFSQYLILKKLSARFENICVVGDDAQSIYAFRGANIQNILNFKNDFPDVKTFKLERNYRSTKNIVNAANSVIAKNKDQFKKDIWTDNEEGSKIEVFKAFTDNEEGLIVANHIFSAKQNHQLNNKDFAILYRTNAQSRSIEEALRRKNIPYRIYGGMSFYQRKEIKDLLAYYKLTVNPNDEEALKRIINYPTRGIGKTSLEKITLKASESRSSLWDVINEPSSFQLKISSAVLKKIEEFVTMIKSFNAQLSSVNAYKLGEHIAKSTGILKDLYADKSPEGLSRYENIHELLNGLNEFSENYPDQSLSEFISEISLLTDADNEDKNNQDSVSLMTIHASKGLEFSFTYLVGLEEGLFPSQLSLNSRTELEEERRLFYVALTRGEKNVCLTHSETRYRWGSLISCEPSRFISEIDKNLIHFNYSGNFYQKGSSFKSDRESYVKSDQINPNTKSILPKQKLVRLQKYVKNDTFKGDDLADLKVGAIVEHQRFGQGEILELEGQDSNQKATIMFENIGQKQLLLRFAKLKIIS
ncbi:MAG: UvrD-helicase domain-containing protein [Flavobacteriales bacterium]|nr:UvrD-helicase domain-containing protein [Flavobacteriales bacterium]